MIKFLIAHDTENRPLLFHLYCKECNKWLEFLVLIGNIKTHIRCKHQVKHQKLTSIDLAPLMFSFIITNGLSFLLIEDQCLAQLLHSPISRQQVAKVCDVEAAVITEKISLQGSTFISTIGEFDEWTDHLSLKYLGLTIHSISNTPEGMLDYHKIEIGHIPISNLYSSQDVLANLTTDRLMELKMQIP